MDYQPCRNMFAFPDKLFGPVSVSAVPYTWYSPWLVFPGLFIEQGGLPFGLWRSWFSWFSFFFHLFFFFLFFSFLFFSFLFFSFLFFSFFFGSFDLLYFFNYALIVWRVKAALRAQEHGDQAPTNSFFFFLIFLSFYFLLFTYRCTELHYLGTYILHLVLWWFILTGDKEKDKAEWPIDGLPL